MFVTEWGTSEETGGGTINWSAVATWISFIENRKLSHANWSISSKSESSSTKPDASSASGQYVKDLISKLNQGQSHNDVKNEPYTCPGGEVIVPPGTVPIINAKHSGFSWEIEVVGKKIIANNIPANAKISIYDLMGNLKSSILPAEVQTGIYIVKINNQTRKVIVK